jgi:acetylornithine aminotransferase
MVFGDWADALGPGSHGSTFGGNPVCCAAALAVLATIEADGLLDHVKRIGELIRRGIEGLGHPLVTEVRGAGLLLGIGLAAPVANVLQEALQTGGFLTNAPRPETLRLAPPLIISAEQVEALLAALPAALDTAAKSTMDGVR